MRGIPAWIRWVLALFFAGATLLYSILWMAASRSTAELPVELGFENNYQVTEQAFLVTRVLPDSPAQKAGLQAGDLIVALNGHHVKNIHSVARVWNQHRPGDVIHLTVERGRERRPLLVTATFRKRISRVNESGWTEYLIGQVRSFYPVPFVLVGLTVLFLRLEDPNVWMLALLFGSFTTIPGFPDTLLGLPEPWWTFASAWQAILVGMLGALFYTFFAKFPSRSPMERRWPWLKWVALALGVVVALAGINSGTLQLPAAAVRLMGPTVAGQLPVAFELTFLTLGLLSLATNYLSSPAGQDRSRIRVIFWGAVAGVIPELLEAAVRNFSGVRIPDSLDAAASAATFFLPLSFAYAVVKHRVLEIPVLLRRSARYLLVQRGFTFLLSAVSIGVTLLFAFSFGRYLRPVIEVTQPSGIAMGALFGTALLWSGSQLHRHVSGRIDRAFFRGAYDARVILEDLAEKARTATERGQLAELLDQHLRQALEPAALAVYLESGERRLAIAPGERTPELHTIPTDMPLLQESARRGVPWEPRLAEDALASLPPDCLVPMLGRDGRLIGLIVLGPRRSEEPYSAEDKRLMASAASQAATALENIRMAEEIAERLESERRTAREMEIAREVQARLLPQAPPPLATLEIAGRCLQARAVGGDCYDFIDLEPGRVGLVLADVSGKGVHAALLMANLQAHLRSQSCMSPDAPRRLLEQVNRMLWTSTAAQHYATLFFGVYEDSTRRISYINCGHNPPVLLRRGGSVERLPATGMVIGAFRQWEGSVEQVQIDPGDLLVIFSDGVSEAMRGEEEFGEARLIETLRAQNGLHPNEIVTAVFGEVQRFSEGIQSDDLTLLVARGTHRAA